MQLSWSQVVLVWALTLLFGSIIWPLILAIIDGGLVFGGNTGQNEIYILFVLASGFYGGLLSLPSLGIQLLVNNALHRNSIIGKKYKLYWILGFASSMLVCLLIVNGFAGGSMFDSGAAAFVLMLLLVYFSAGCFSFLLLIKYLENRKNPKFKSTDSDIIDD